MHKSVLVREAIEGLNLKEGDIFVDGTLGSAGHSAEVAKRFGDEVEIIGLDRDIEALERSGEKLRTLTAAATLKLGSFRNIDTVLADLGISQVNAILLDLGLSSDQIEVSGRGFTFQKDEPLKMTMSKGEEGLTAETILNTWDEESIELILRGFGEEKYSRKIAAEIVRRREDKPFETTFDLVRAVVAAARPNDRTLSVGQVPASHKRFKIHPATRTFQALRIAVNEELTALEEGLEKGFEVLAPQGRFVVISFHSLEDRIVKNFFRDRVKEDKAQAVTKKPVVASEEEEQENPRARSAKLRVLEKL
ncbi:16S rRNA (cytosine(1402)-N(4))-methyltransferase RsmH [Candidatus Parcubacteria bacterium]|nr:16S rRNA (cytosine(1402)-N(4))-methyltransferase RsmH [Candidatus Parcubacteria bacterium]